MHTSDKVTNFIDSRNYAQATVNITLPIDQNQTTNKNESTKIKELLKQSLKNSEMLAKMVIKQNAPFRQQTQQLTIMVQVLANALIKK